MSTDPSRYMVGPNSTITDVDLDEEDRVPESLRATAEAKATAEGVSLSVLAREALEHYLAS